MSSLRAAPGARRSGRRARRSSSAASAPPAFSRSVNCSHARSASSAVTDSTYQEPPAASTTRPRLDSSCRTAEVLRAIRRAKSSGSPSAVSNGSTVIASAPPTAAAKQPIVVRSMFTHGSCRVSMTAEVTACWCCARSAEPRQLGDPLPHLPGGAQLGDRAELVGAHGEAELEAVERLVHRQAGVGELTQVGHARPPSPQRSRSRRRRRHRGRPCRRRSRSAAADARGRARPGAASP